MKNSISPHRKVYDERNYEILRTYLNVKISEWEKTEWINYENQTILAVFLWMNSFSEYLQWFYQ